MHDFQNARYETLFDIMDEVVLGFYMTEILLKWYCSFFMFWMSFWNVFDFIIVVAMFSSNGRQLSK